MDMTTRPASLSPNAAIKKDLKPSPKFFRADAAWHKQGKGHGEEGKEKQAGKQGGKFGEIG